jgi:hypothetical protein
MFYIIVILAGIFAMPAKAFDATPLPPNTVPTFKAAPLDLPPGLLSQAPNPAKADVDPFIGTWKLNTAKSTSTYPLNKSHTLNIVREGQNLVANADGVDAQGQPFKRMLQHIYDGHPHPTTGNPDWDATAFTRVGNTINAVRFKNGKVVEVAQYIIDPGKTYSGHSEGVTANGQPYHDYLVWDRQ